MTTIPLYSVRTLALAGLLVMAGTAHANDFPTLDRVVFVQECMRAHPGPTFEMTSKCSCALDSLARQVKYDDFVTMSTVGKAMTIGGERGGSIRDAASLAPQAKRFREVVQQAEKSCFIGNTVQ